MKFDQYQKLAYQHAIFPEEYKILYPALALNEEAGEVAGKIGKALRDQTPLPIAEIRKELGDVLWQLSALATGLEQSLDALAEENLDKLEDRKNRGVLSGSGDNR